MSFLVGGGGHKVKPRYTGIQLQTSSQTAAFTIAWGANRFAPNLIWYGDFKSHKQKQKAGKGGGGTVTDYTYSAACAMALCEGTISGIGKVWKDQDTNASLSSLGLSLFTGTVPQSPWGYLTSKHPSEAYAYAGVAYLAASNYDLGSSATLPNHSFEVKARQVGTGWTGGDDADCAVIIDEFLTNESFGVLFSPSAIDTDQLYSTANAGTTGDASYQTYCRAMGFGMSPALSDQEEAGAILERWGKVTNTAVVWTGYSLKFVPYCYETITGNGVTFVPETTPVYDLTDDDYVSNGDDPVKVSRKDPADCYNQLRLVFKDRTNDYNDAPMPWEDQGLIEQFGKRPASDFTAHDVCVPAMALKSVSLYGKRNAYVRNKYEFTLGPAHCLLEPMDVVNVEDPELGIVPVQITNITEQDNGDLDFEADEIAPGLGVAASYTPQTGGGFAQNTGVDPGDVNPPVIFEPPADLSGGTAQIWAAVSGGDGTTANDKWGGCLVYVSADGGTTYQAVGRIDSPARMGKLTANLSSYGGSNPDTVNTAAVDLAMSAGELVSVSSTEAAKGTTLCYVDGEYLSFQTATLTDTNEYDLTDLYRGLYGSTPGAHTTGDDFARLDENIFEYDLPADYVGQALKFKFPSFNIYGGGLQDLADVDEYDYTPAGTGFGIAPPSSVALTFSPRTQPDGTGIITGTVTLGPSAGPYLDHYDVQVAVDPYTDWVDIPAVSAAGTKTQLEPAIANTDYKARARAVSSAVDGIPSNWVESSVSNSGGVASAAPNAPTGLTGTGAILANNLSCTAPASGATPTGYRWYAIHSDTGSFGSATLIGQTSAPFFTHSGLGVEDTWRYWVVAYNSVGNSTEAGPQNVTTSTEGGGGSVEVDQEDTPVVSPASVLNFKGAGVTVTDAGGGTADIEIPGAGTKTTPVVRSSNMARYSGGSTNVPLPAGAVAGDTCVIFYAGAWGGAPSGSGAGAGWSTYSQLIGSNWNGAMFVKTLTSTEITAGVIPFNNGNGSDWGVYSALCLEGTYVVRSSAGDRSGSGVSSDTLTVNGLQVADLVLYFGSNRGNSTDEVDRGTEVQTMTKSDVSSVLSKETSPVNGSRTATYTYSTGGSGYYEGIIAFEGTSSGIALSDLDDVNLPGTPSDGWVLTWDADAGFWVAAPAGGSSGPARLVFPYTGSDVSLSIPAGVTSARVKMWGGGGGGGRYSGGHYGGAGGFTDVSFDVEEGDNLLLQVAGGGQNLSGVNNAGGYPDGGVGSYGDATGGGGGGSSRVWRNSDLIGVAGGGGGSAGYSGNGGAGGGTTGQTSISTSGGTGGTQSAGGYDINDSGNTVKQGLSLIAVGANARTGAYGGTQGSSTGDDGGAGGGGYWGGGGGGGDASSGGGGSGYVDATAVGTTTVGSGQTPAGTSDPDYPGSPVAIGGVSNTDTGGGDGYIVVYLSGTAPYRMRDLLDAELDGVADGEVPTWSETLQAWIPGTAGGSGEPAATPTSLIRKIPTADKFTTLGSIPTGSAPTLADDSVNGLLFNFGAPSSGAKFARHDVPSGADFEIVTRFKAGVSPSNDNAGLGIHVHGSGSGNTISFVRYATNTNTYFFGLARWSSSSFTSSTLNTPTTHSYDLDWLRLRYVASTTTLYYDVSPDGEKWLTLYSHNISGILTPDGGGLFGFSDDTVTGNPDMWARILWYEAPNVSPHAVGLGGGIGSTRDEPQLVQMATLRNGGTLALPSTPTPGNLLVFVAGGYSGSLSNYVPGSGLDRFSTVSWFNSDGNNAVSCYTRIVQSGDVGSWSMSASDNQFCAVYEFANAAGVQPGYGSYMITSGNDCAADVGRSVFDNAIRLLVMENDTDSTPTVDPATGLTVDFATSGGGNHTGAIIRLGTDFVDGRVTATFASGLSAAVFGFWNVVGTQG